MNSESRDAENRKLQEWLGLLMPTKEETEAALVDGRFGWRHWTLHRRLGAPIERFSSYYWTGLDFFRSAEASMLLLNKMPEPHVWKNPDGSWTCEPSSSPGALDSEIIESGATLEIAIALAALALIEKEAQK